MYLSYFGACFRFSVAERRALKEVEALVTNHEEASTLICTHISHTDKENTSNIGVRASDTVVAVILLIHSERFNVYIWMETGTESKNNRWFIDIRNCSWLGTSDNHVPSSSRFPCLHWFRLYFSVLQERQEVSLQNS